MLRLVPRLTAPLVWGLCDPHAGGSGDIAPPVNLSVPTIAGNALTGATLTGTAGSWTGATIIDYQWQVVPISGVPLTGNVAAGPMPSRDPDPGVSLNYTVNERYQMVKLKLVETATNSAGSTSAESAEFGPIAINFGTKTPSMEGGFPLGAAQIGATFSGTNSADFIFDERGMCVPSGTYNANKTFAASSYSLTASTGLAVPIRMQSGIAHAREMTGTAQGGACTINADATNTTHQFNAIASVATRMANGERIKFRSGRFNPQDLGLRHRPPATGWVSGGGELIVESEDVDHEINAHGHPRLRHGAVWSYMAIDTTVSGDLAFPLRFKNIYWLKDHVGAGQAAFFKFQTSAGSGVAHENCRVEVASSITNPSTITGFSYNKNGRTYGCHVLGMSKGFTYQETATNHDCIAENLLEDGIAKTGTGDDIRRFFMFNPKHYAGTHPDPVQTLRIVGAGAKEAGVGYDVIAVRGDGDGLWNDYQGWFSNADTAEVTDTQDNLVLENSVFHVNYRNAIYLNKFNNPRVRCCLAVSLPAAMQAGMDGASSAQIYVPADGAGAGGDFSWNITNVLFVSSQTGTVTTTPNLVLPLRTIEEYQAVWPNYTGVGMYTREEVIRQFTPADKLVADGGAKDPSGKFFGPYFPATAGNDRGAKNDLSVFEPNNPTWVAAHPPAV